MNLTKEISSRQLDFKPAIEVKDKTVFIADINTEIDLKQNWQVASGEIYEEAKANFILPEIEELSSKDKKTYKESIFPPLLFLVSNKIRQHVFNPVILSYLYKRGSLTGSTLLNIRSINKFEMMWAPYFIDAQGPFRTNPKVFSLCGMPASLSKSLNFVFRSRLYPQLIESRLITLTIDLNEFVLAFYIVDNTTCQFTEEEILEFIQSIKIKA